MINKIEAYFMKEMSEKAGRLAIFSLFLLIPNYSARIFFMFLLVVNMLPWDIKNKRFSSLMALPYSYSQIFWISFLVMSVINAGTFVIGGALGAGIFAASPVTLGINLLGSLIFTTSYYSISMICVTMGLDNFGIPLLIMIGDLILGGIGNKWNNPYFYVSPVHQGNTVMAGAVAVGLLLLAAYLFNRKGVSKI